jgi:nucleotide-binding universal stress UspA family protein
MEGMMSVSEGPTRLGDQESAWRDGCVFDKVIVGVDGRDGGRDAIALARRLGAPDSAVAFAHVYGMPTLGGRAGVIALQLQMETAERLLADEAVRASSAAELVAIHDPSVARGLHGLAAQRGIDLLVLGSCHRGLLGRTLLGDDARRVLGRAPCAVAIAPRGYGATGSRPGLTQIGVGCDVSSPSGRTMRVAHALAARHHATIKALSVVSLQRIPYGEPVPQQWPQIAGQLVVDELHRISDLEGVEGDAAYGHPGEMLAEFSADLDLLIVGSRSRGALGRRQHGGTPNYLARHARCPLLVVPLVGLRSVDLPGRSSV